MVFSYELGFQHQQSVDVGLVLLLDDVDCVVLLV
jgi:hypothetical protein